MKQRLQTDLTSARERGAVMFLVAATVMIVLLAGAVAVDLSIVATRGQSMQDAADAAALAGVQAYRESMGDDLVADSTDEAAAIAAAQAILVQNGITGLTPVVSFPDQVNFTEVRVELVDSNPGTLLGEITGSGNGVKRAATAEFERCDDGCNHQVTIPEPFRSVDATGNGDGFVPIPVGNKLYAINHHADTGQMVCVSRETQRGCWGTETNPIVERPAYPAGYTPSYTPEMPHAAVVGNQIFWAISLSSGHYLVCWNADTDTPCSTPYLLNNETYDTTDSWAIEHQGGGTFAYGGRVYTFTGDHRIHCVEPGVTMSPCASFASTPTQLGAALFPANREEDGNHGSSIDRVVDEANGRVYATIHIDNEVPTGSVDCLSPLADPIDQTVIVENVGSGRFIYGGYNGGTSVEMSADGDDSWDRWNVTGGPNGSYLFESVERPGYYMDWDEVNGYDRVNIEQIDGSSDSHQYWRITDDNGSSVMINNYDFHTDTWLIDATSGGYYDVYTSTSTYYDERWQIWPWQCGLTNYTPLPEPTLPYETGTWVHCFDLINNQGCSGFTPSRLHVGDHYFNGRLFFYMDSGATPSVDGVCSSGFDVDFEIFSNTTTNYSNNFEIVCVDHLTGDSNADAQAQEAALASVQSTIANTVAGSDTNGNGSRWGTWGVPHWNESSNRLFFPTQRANSLVICYDFDTELTCGAPVEGTSPSSPYTAIQDYGFYSEGLCVFGLGHNAVFWAFQADRPDLECSGSSAETTIQPCRCGADYFWGSLTFDVDLHLFDVFMIEVFDSTGTRVWPPEDPANPGSPGQSLHTDGDTLDLNQLPVAGPSDELTIQVYVEADSNPWAQGEQTFSIEIARTPHLTD